MGWRALLLRPRARPGSSCGSFRFTSVVDPHACLWIEEVQRARVDRDLDVAAVPDARPCTEAADERRVRVGCLRRAVVSRVFGELEYLVRDGGLRIGGEMDHDLRTEGL